MRGHNVIHLLPADWAAIPAALGQALERVDVQAGSTQLLVIVANAEAAMGVSSVLNGATAGTPRSIAATGSDRTARILRAGAAPIVVGAPSQLVALLAASALKLNGLRTVVIAWIDEILAAGGTGALDALLTDVPKDAYRVRDHRRVLSPGGGFHRATCTARASIRGAAGRGSGSRR